MINIFTFQNLVEAMDLNALRAFALELLWRQPAAFADLVNGELPGAPLEPDPEEPDPENPECGANVDVVLQCQHKLRSENLNMAPSLCSLAEHASKPTE